jgi:hypothetical protein
VSSGTTKVWNFTPLAGASPEAIATGLQQRWHLTRNSPHQRSGLQETIYHAGAQEPAKGRMINAAVFEVDTVGRPRNLQCAGGGAKLSVVREAPLREYVFD